jgi:hypothetical protein
MERNVRHWPSARAHRPEDVSIDPDTPTSRIARAADDTPALVSLGGTDGCRCRFGQSAGLETVELIALDIGLWKRLFSPRGSFLSGWSHVLA